MPNNNTKERTNKPATNVADMLPTDQTRFVAYFRVSTDKQGQSGLGLEAQQAMTSRYNVVDSFVEIESGRKHDRPQLMAAIDQCKKTGATLLVAKLDRLSRSVYFTSQLMESGIQFKCCDMPEANRLTLQLMAVLAEHEARTIAARTKAALAAKKARGEQLGNVDNLTQEGRTKGAEAMRAKAQTAYAHLVPMIRELKVAGESLATIAGRLNEVGQRTTRGTKFSAMQVSRILRRA